MFIDRTSISFQAGNGGNGCLSFRREKYIPHGGPDGGDGGDGGDIILISTQMCQSLGDFKYKKLIKAESGGQGRSKKRTGKNGATIVLEVPAGTVVKTFPDEKLIFDFDRIGLQFILAKGGKGGRGNIHFKSSVNQAPRRAEKRRKRGKDSSHPGIKTHRFRRTGWIAQRREIDFNFKNQLRQA